MALVNITKAAKLAGITRQYLHKHYVKQGKISVTQDDKGNPQIDTSEILRVFGKLHDVNDDGNSFQEITPVNDIKNNDFAVEVQLLRQQVEHQKALLDEKDRRLADYAQMLNLLTDKSAPVEKKSIFTRPISSFFK
jgi:DNA-binding transcriptional MerR regulator